jgi:hypothetical protein
LMEFGLFGVGDPVKIAEDWAWFVDLYRRC